MANELAVRVSASGNLPGPAEDSQCYSPAPSQRIRGTVQRTHRPLGDLWVSPALSTFDRIARYRQRFLLHGVVAAVGVAAISTIALQPRPTLPERVTASAVEASPPMVDLNATAPPSTTAAPVDAPVSDTPEATISPPVPPKPITHTVDTSIDELDTAIRAQLAATTASVPAFVPGGGLSS